MSYEPRPCTACGGTRGRIETVHDGKSTRQTWHPCRACGGRGIR